MYNIELFNYLFMIYDIISFIIFIIYNSEDSDEGSSLQNFYYLCSIVSTD